MIKGILMTIRLLWLVSLATGIMMYFQYALPVKFHMYIGFIIAFLMLALSGLGIKRYTGLATATAIVAVLLPIIGIVQLTKINTPQIAMWQALHVVIGVAAIALAEIQGKRCSIAV